MDFMLDIFILSAMIKARLWLFAEQKGPEEYLEATHRKIGPSLADLFPINMPFYSQLLSAVNIK